MFGKLWNRLNQGQALGILATSGTEIAAIFDVFARKPYLSNSEGEEFRAHKKMYVQIERVKDLLRHADNQMYGEHVRRGNEGYKKDSQRNKKRNPWTTSTAM